MFQFLVLPYVISQKLVTCKLYAEIKSFDSMNSIYRRVEIFFTNEMTISTNNKDPNAANNKK